MSNRYLALPSFALLLGTASLAHATNGYFANGYGETATGSGGAAAALPQDTLVVATNPAGLSSIGNRVDVGADVFVPDRSATIRGNGAGLNGTYSGNGKKNFVIPAAGYSQQINPALTLGIAAYGNGGLNTVYKTNPFGFGKPGTGGVDLKQLFISPTAAYKLNDTNTLGLALNLAYQTFEAKGLQAFGPLSSNASNLSDNGSATSTGIGVRLGWLGQLTPWLSAGASWASKISTGKFDKYSGLFAKQGSFDIPENYVIGLAAKPADNVTLALDWQTIKYGAISSIANSDANQAPLGSDGGPGFGWRDEHVVKLGVVYQASPDLTLRAGFSAGKQPVPESQTLFNILAPGVVEKHITLGGSWALGKHDNLTLAYVQALKRTVSGNQSIPPSFGGGDADISLAERSLGISWGHTF